MVELKEERCVVAMVSAEVDLFVLDNFGRVWVWDDDNGWQPLPALPSGAAESLQVPKFEGSQ